MEIARLSKIMGYPPHFLSRRDLYSIDTLSPGSYREKGVGNVPYGSSVRRRFQQNQLANSERKSL
jgi:hypothetical protein